MGSTLNARVALKHDTDANWESVATTFIPLNGEFIYYETSKRFKIGDGETAVGDLDFFEAGASSYNDLADAPISLRNVEYTQQDNIGTGVFMGNTFTKVSTQPYAVNDLVGGTVTTDAALPLTAAIVQDMASMASGMGYTGDMLTVVTPSGNVQSFDYVVIALDADFTVANMGINMTAGTYIASTVTELTLPQTIVIDQDYAQAFLPVVSAADNGKSITVAGGKWVASAKDVAGISDYGDIQRILGNGAGLAVFPYWHGIKSTHGEFGDLMWNVVNHETTTNNMAVLAKEMLNGFEFDAVEALCVCSSGLAAGTYYIDLSSSSWSGWDTTFSFTLTQNVPANGILVFKVDYYEWTPAGISSRASVTATTDIETVELVEEQSGTDLTSVIDAADFNNYRRAIGGSGNFAQSAIYKYLNSDAGPGEWWTPSHKFDTPPSYVNRKGFLAELDPAFVDALEEVTLTCATTRDFEIDYTTNSSYTVNAKIWLPSITELCGDLNNNIAEGAIFGALDGKSNDYIQAALQKHISGTTTNWWWWQRSCDPVSPEHARLVNVDGNPRSRYSAGSPLNGFAPACTIKAI